MKSRVIGAAAALCFALLPIGPVPVLAQSSLDQIKAAGVLMVATDPGWPPMSWQNEDGEWNGFDVEVTKEIARRLGVDVRYYMPYSFDDVLAGNWERRWDIATSVTPSVQRGEKIQFGGVYNYGAATLAVHRDNTTVQVPSDVSGKRIGVAGGTEYEKYLAREPFDVVDMPPFTYKIADPQIVPFEGEPALYAALAKGDGVELEAIIDDLSAVMQEIGNGTPIRIIGQPLAFTPSAIAVDKDEDELAAALKEIIEAMHKDGTLSRLSIKWFEYDLSHY